MNTSADAGTARGAAAPATAVPGSALPSADRSDAAAAGTAAAGQSQPQPPGPAVTSAEGPDPVGTAGPAGATAQREAAAPATRHEAAPAARHEAAPPAQPEAAPPAQREAALVTQRDPAAVRAFVERFAAQLTQAGFPRTPARIFVALLTSDSSKLTAAELGEILQASPASISGGVRYLIQVGLAAAQGEPGSRRLHYWVSEDVWRDIVRLRDRLFTSWAAELRLGAGVLGRESPAGVRMAETASYFEFISDEMAGLLARWEARRAGSPASGTE